MQTQIILLLKKQSNQGLPNLLFGHEFCEFEDKQHLIREPKQKSVQNSRTFTECVFLSFHDEPLNFHGTS